MDDPLGHHIGGGRLGAEQNGDRLLGELAGLDLQILMDDIQGVHLLALVLVEPLDLNVKDGLRVDLDVLPGPEHPAQVVLIVLLHLQQPGQHPVVLLEGQQALQLGGVSAPVGADAAVNEGG